MVPQSGPSFEEIHPSGDRSRTESSSVVGGTGLAAPGAPVIRQVRTEGDSLVTLGKPTVVATLDDVGTNRRYEIEVTVTKVK